MQSVTIRSLNDGWRFQELRPLDLAQRIGYTNPLLQPGPMEQWYPAEVPGHVYLDLQRIGMIPDPFEQMYERTVQWVDEVDWIYGRTLTLSGEELTGARHILRFGGLDTVARVMVNDRVVGEPDNMFIAHEFDITDVLHAGENSLVVEFSSAQRV